MSIKVREITTFEEFLNLREAWDDLAERQEQYTPFLSHDWFKIWLENFLDRESLLILLFYDQDVLQLICPFLSMSKYFKGTSVMRTKELFRGLPVNEIQFIGNAYSPVLDFIIDPSARKEALMSACISYFLKDHRKWDLINLYSMPPESGTLSFLHHLLSRYRLRSHEYFCFGNWYLKGIDFSGLDYMARRKSNIKNNIKRYTRQLNKKGRINIQFIFEPEDIDNYIDLYYRVYKKSWKEPEPNVRFHHDLAKFAANKGWLFFGFLFLDDLPIASQLWLVHKQIAYVVRLVYDTSYKKYIPGIILMAEMTKYAIDVMNVKQIDNLVGDEPYKKDWTPMRRERKGLHIFNKNAKGTLLALAETKMVPVLRKFDRVSRILNHI